MMTVASGVGVEPAATVVLPGEVGVGVLALVEAAVVVPDAAVALVVEVVAAVEAGVVAELVVVVEVPEGAAVVIWTLAAWEVAEGLPGKVIAVDAGLWTLMLVTFLVVRSILIDVVMGVGLPVVLSKGEGGVLVIRRIQLAAFLQADPTQQSDAEEAIAVYALKCPLYRTLHGSIEISSRLHFQAGTSSST